jgi:heterodisulfide reductase subunit A
MVEVDRHQNIEVLTFAEVDSVEGEVGDFRVTVVRKPRYIIEDICTGCGTCVQYCPKESPNLFNQEISSGKAVHVYFSQAIPLVAYIDDNCLNLKEGKCDICMGVCQNEAIDFRQWPEKIDVNVGTIILSAGIAPFDPATVEEYGYRKFQNVVTSMDYERLLSATGPYQGEILRASDKQHPQKIAWIQCVGSRRVTPGENSYCSGVCCMYTQKQVILTKEHEDEAECTVFHNDIRAFGKDFERYYQRTEDLPGVRFIRSYVSIEREVPESNNVVVRYATDNDGVKEEEFDMVVLSVGLNPPADHQKLSDTYGIELNSDGFSHSSQDNPMETTRPGIFASGGLRGPIDIPESVFSASGASAQCGEYLDYRRGKLARERIYPPERDVADQEPKRRKRAQQGGHSGLFPENPRSFIPRHTSRGGAQSVFLRDGEYSGTVFVGPLKTEGRSDPKGEGYHSDVGGAGGTPGAVTGVRSAGQQDDAGSWRRNRRDDLCALDCQPGLSGPYGGKGKRAGWIGEENTHYAGRNGCSSLSG